MIFEAVNSRYGAGLKSVEYNTQEWTFWGDAGKTAVSTSFPADTAPDKFLGLLTLLHLVEEFIIGFSALQSFQHKFDGAQLIHRMQHFAQHPHHL